VAVQLGRDLPPVEVGFTPEGNDPDLMFALQLVPEYCEILSAYSRVCFIDAHTGAIQCDLNMIKIDPGFQTSPFTHHLTPMTCLSLCQTIYGTHPEAMMVSVRGYDFGFTRDLSQKTTALAQEAANKISAWLTKG
jgi:Ni,Fe-hydrogenase maturation factor